MTTNLKKLNDVLNVEPDITLDINENYDGFVDFYDKNKDVIYRNLVTLFKGFTESDKKTRTLAVTATIQDIPWGTEFVMDKNNKETLVHDIIPYFEQIEDYEFCEEIMGIYKSLN